MVVSVQEKWESRRTTEGENPSVELVYVIRGTSDDLEASAALLTASPLTYHGLVRQSRELERLAEDAWQGSVRYGVRQTNAGDVEWEFDTTGGTEHITHSLGTVGTYPAPGRIAPNFRQAIGVSGDNIQGLDVVVPVFNFTLRATLPDSMVTPAYRATVYWLTGCVNQSPFYGFAAGELKFLGATGAKRNQDSWQITYRFAASPNVNGLVIGGITGITKRGWDYLWVYSEAQADDDAKALVPVPIAVYIEQVCRYADFTQLGI